jgi:hypothetical protein
MLHFGSQSRCHEHRVERAAISMARWQLGLLLALILPVSLTACGTQQEGSEQAPSRTARTSRVALSKAAPDGDIPHQLLDNFTLLRTPPNGIPPAIRQSLKVPVSGMSWSLARRVPVSLPGMYWLAPGAEDLCIVATTPKLQSVGTVCASVNQALRHGIANTSLDPVSGRRIIVGVAPKGTHTVLLQSGASTTSVSVRRGRFVLRDTVSSPPDRLTLR